MIAIKERITKHKQDKNKDTLKMKIKIKILKKKNTKK